MKTTGGIHHLDNQYSTTILSHFYEIEMLDWSKISEFQALVSLQYVSSLHIPP